MKISKSSKNKKQKGAAEFAEIIKHAIYEGADSVTIEYDDGGLEMSGHSSCLYQNQHNNACNNWLHVAT